MVKIICFCVKTSFVVFFRHLQKKRKEKERKCIKITQKNMQKQMISTSKVHAELVKIRNTGSIISALDLAAIGNGYKVLGSATISRAEWRWADGCACGCKGVWRCALHPTMTSHEHLFLPVLTNEANSLGLFCKTWYFAKFKNLVLFHLVINWTSLKTADL